MKNFDLLNIILKWKKTLAAVLGLSVLLSAIFSSSLFIKPKYKSVAIVYPSNLFPYSQESPTEQMLQLFQSDSVFNHVVKYFNLVEHYKLDSASPILRNELIGMYNENISIKKTEYEAVKIEVLDIDPKVACNMISEMLNAFNAYTLDLNRGKSKELIAIYGGQMKRKKTEMDSINTALKELAVKFGLIDYNAQSRELSKEYYRSIASGNEKKIGELTNSLRNLEERGGEFRELQQRLDLSTNEYNSLLIKYNTSTTDVLKFQTYTNIVLKPYPSDKKAYPVRWLIVTIAACASLLFSILVIMVIEGRQQAANPKS